MILRNLGALTQDPAGFFLIMLFTLSGLIIAITVHEFSHALVATGLGDTTAKRLGRLSLNPLSHLDPLGSLMLLLAGFGWGKPVPVNAGAFGQNASRDMALVSLAGPFSNILMAALLAIPFKAGLLTWPFTESGHLSGTLTEYFASSAFGIAIFYNLLLAVFNLIPLGPLDGSKVIPGILPQRLARAYQRLEPSGTGILMSIIFLDIFLGTGILANVLFPPVNLLSSVMTGHPIF